MRWALLILGLAACGGGGAPTPETRPQVAGPRPVGTWSNARGFHARWRPIEGEIPLNQEFDAEVWLSEDEAGTQPIEEADVVLDCRMPAHRHGMLQDVQLVHTGEGRYLAQGLLCHMLGHWELYVDLTRGPITERAQWDLEVR